MKKYVITTYLVFWVMVLGICGSASMVFHASPFIMRVLSNVCAWSPTIVLLLMWKKLRPKQRRVDFISSQFAGSLKWYLLLFLIVIIAGGSLLSVFLLSILQEKSFSSYFAMGSYSFFASFLFSLLSGLLAKSLAGEAICGRNWIRSIPSLEPR